MRYAQIRSMDISNGKGIGVSLFVQGCHFHCKECFNPETWNFDGGKEWTEHTEKYFLALMDKPYIKRISILGGEPFAPENYKTVLELCSKIKQEYPDKQIWVYTGYKYEDLDFSLSTDIDILVDGQFEINNKDLNLQFYGSSNQRIIDVKKTIEQNEIITMDL